MGRVKRVELEDVSFRESVTISAELNENYFREIANRTVAPILQALRGVWEKYKFVSWNHIVGAGLSVYNLIRKGVTDERVLVNVVTEYLRNKGYQRNIQQVARDIVRAVLASL